MQISFLSAFLALAAAVSAAPAVEPRAGAPDPGQYLPTGEVARGWAGQGCYADLYPHARILNGPYLEDKAMTIEKCLQFCDTKGTTYAGLEYGYQCFCDNKLTNAVKKADAETLNTKPGGCTTEAAGKRYQNAGGPNAVLLFKSTRAAPPKVRNPSPVDAGNGKLYNYIGCFKDFPGRRLLPHLVGVSQQRTNTGCIKTCSKLGFKFASTQNGNECRCGNGTNRPVATDTCKKVCTGISTEYCGGADYAQSLYSL